MVKLNHRGYDILNDNHILYVYLIAFPPGYNLKMFYVVFSIMTVNLVTAMNHGTETLTALQRNSGKLTRKREMGCFRPLPLYYTYLITLENRVFACNLNMTSGVMRIRIDSLIAPPQKIQAST